VKINDELLMLYREIDYGDDDKDDNYDDDDTFSGSDDDFDYQCSCK